MLGHRTVKTIASRYDATPGQIVLAWLLQQPGMSTIPKASSPEHIRENRAALDIQLTDRDCRELDQAFPPPRRKVPLEMV